MAHIFTGMKISNYSLRKKLILVFGLLIVLSLTDLILSRVNGSIHTYFWGYLFLVNILVVFVLYAYMGFPIFRFNGESEMLEISSGFALASFIEKEYYINRRNLIDFKIDNKFLRRELQLLVQRQESVEKIYFPISFLNRSQVDKLKTYLQEIIGDKNKELLFI